MRPCMAMAISTQAVASSLTPFDPGSPKKARMASPTYLSMVTPYSRAILGISVGCWELSELTGRRRKIDRLPKKTTRGELKTPVAIDPKILAFRFTQARRRQSLVAGAHGFMNCIFQLGRPGVLQVKGLDRPLFGAQGRAHQIANRRSPSAPNKIECRLRRAQGGQEFGALLRR